MIARAKSSSASSQPASSPVIGYLPQDRPPFAALLTLGLQHVLTMFPATVLVAILTKFDVGVTLLASGIGTIINEVVEILLDLTGSNLTPEYRPQELSFVTHRIGSTEKAARQLGFRATTPLVEGLRRVVEWRLSSKAAG